MLNLNNFLKLLFKFNQILNSKPFEYKNLNLEKLKFDFKFFLNWNLNKKLTEAKNSNRKTLDFNNPCDFWQNLTFKISTKTSQSPTKPSIGRFQFAQIIDFFKLIKFSKLPPPSTSNSAIIKCQSQRRSYLPSTPTNPFDYVKKWL